MTTQKALGPEKTLPPTEATMANPSPLGPSTPGSSFTRKRAPSVDQKQLAVRPTLGNDSETRAPPVAPDRAH